MQWEHEFYRRALEFQGQHLRVTQFDKRGVGLSDQFETIPTIEEPDAVLQAIESALASGMVTNGPLVRELEEKAAAELGADHCVAVASCTLGLLLVVQALEVPGPVLAPSFTFSATAHAAAWNGKNLMFADCDAVTWNLGPDNVYGQPGLVLAVHVSVHHLHGEVRVHEADLGGGPRGHLVRVPPAAHI